MADKVLEKLYELHDAYEVALRVLEAPLPGLQTIRAATWKAHDELERIVIREQAKRGKV